MSSTSAAQEAKEFEPREFVAQGDRQVDRRVLWLNLLLLLCVVLIPPDLVAGNGV